MKKFAKILLAVVTLCIIAGISFQLGKNHVIYNAEIRDEQNRQGTYKMTIDGEVHEYWNE